MSRGSKFLFALLVGGLPGCGASASKAAVDAAESQAQSARAEATREHAQLIEIEARLLELEHRLASQARACKATRDPQPVAVASSREQPGTKPLRSEGDFLVEAHPIAPAAPPSAKVALGASPQPAAPVSEREHLEQLLEQLRAYGYDPQSGLSLERREALRVLLRRERPLDMMNPWDER